MSTNQPLPDQPAGAPIATTYPVTGSIGTMDNTIIQLSVSGGSGFSGSTFVPAMSALGGELSGTLSTPDIKLLYSNTSAFQATASATSVTIDFLNNQGNTLGTATTSGLNFPTVSCSISGSGFWGM